MHDNSDEAAAAARARPGDVSAQIAAAYACDRAGNEKLASEFYDAAWRLGVPLAELTEFIIGYGSTLRNVGRADEAVSILEALVRDHPDNPAARCFYGLALHSAGRHGAACAELLEVALRLHQASPDLTKYRRALSAYRDELRNE
jgi:hypothetical protein